MIRPHLAGIAQFNTDSAGVEEGVLGKVNCEAINEAIDMKLMANNSRDMDLTFVKIFVFCH